MKTLQKGFTLIELMIVVAIVGILAAIALPAYQDYIARAKMTEPLAKLDEIKLSVAEYYASNNATPANASSAGIGSAGGWTSVTGPTYYTHVGYEEVTANTTVKVAVKMNSAANSNLADKALIMTGTIQSDGSVSWTCGSDVAAASLKLLPANCRAAGTITPE
jgi:type IV pilus assembly protein PilA